MKRLRYEIGELLCRVGRHKKRRHVERDSVHGYYMDSYDCCERCGAGPL